MYLTNYRPWIFIECQFKPIEFTNKLIPSLEKVPHLKVVRDFRHIEVWYKSTSLLSFNPIREEITFYTITNHREVRIVNTILESLNLNYQFIQIVDELYLMNTEN